MHGALGVGNIAAEVAFAELVPVARTREIEFIIANAPEGFGLRGGAES